MILCVTRIIKTKPTSILLDAILFFLTCKLSWTRSASLFAKADSRMLACSRSALWDWANPASFPFSCSSSSANFLLASSNFRIRFLKQRDSWSCGSNTCHWYKKLNNKQQTYELNNFRSANKPPQLYYWWKSSWNYFFFHEPTKLWDT